MPESVGSVGTSSHSPRQWRKLLLPAFVRNAIRLRSLKGHNRVSGFAGDAITSGISPVSTRAGHPMAIAAFSHAAFSHEVTPVAFNLEQTVVLTEARVLLPTSELDVALGGPRSGAPARCRLRCDAQGGEEGGRGACCLWAYPIGKLVIAYSGPMAGSLSCSCGVLLLGDGKP